MAKPVVRFSFPALGEPEDTHCPMHRIRNCIEDLQRDIELAGLGFFAEDPDVWFTSLTLKVSKNRHNAAVKQIVEQQLKQHHLEDHVVIPFE